MLREEAIKMITERRILSPTIDEKMRGKTITQIYGMNVFNEKNMEKFLSYKVFHSLQKIIKEGGVIDASLAEEVASGMKEWAISRGATHFTHWFHPLTGLTAEKHDSFLSFDRSGHPIERFSGSNLIQGEPDASSFPSGGLRSTFEARGYTAWDPSSPAFLVEGINGVTLCIPSLFLSYRGDALDKKTPLLRSMESLSIQAIRILRLFGNRSVTRVWTTVGPEQEYFLVDKEYFNRRPDLILTGRTLFGAKPPKGQEMEDHYFGSIRERVLAFMQEVDNELLKLGVPVKTRHNEVAPSQFEIAPIFEDSNIATDHNQIVMEVLRKVASKHNFAILLHEKPFAGINGSGKHNNWSLCDSDGNNLLDPGKTPHDNLQFLTFFISTIYAVYKYGDLLRASIASAGNDHRLGANEAPPAIISVFIGEQLTSILNNIETNKSPDYTDSAIIDLGLSKIPSINKDQTDRNRTSPFAFTGNKFEFRAVGSSQSIAPANYTLNTIVADVLKDVADKIESLIKSGKSLNQSVMEVLIPMIKESEPVRFEGNNYDPEWEKEAKKRGLPNKKTTPEAIADFMVKKNVEVFVRHNVLSEEEISSRYKILLEQYIKTVNIEAECALTIAKTMILPVCMKHQNNLLSATSAINDKIQKELVNKYVALVSDFITKITELERAMDKKDSIEDEEKKAEFFCKEILPAMNRLRACADLLEEETDDSLWPLPKYREMLFVY